MAEQPDQLDIIEPTNFTRAEQSKRVSIHLFQPVRLLIFIVFILLGTAAWFMFSAKAVELAITPEPAFIDISEGFSYRLGERFLMLPGSYQVRAGLDGYEILETTVEIGDEDSQLIPLALTKLPGILTITTPEVATAEVFIDQEYAGTTPFEDDAISAGLHDISIRAERYLPYDTEIDIEGMRQSQALSIELDPAWAMVTFRSVPAGADILVSGEELGTTPATVPIMQGSQEVMLSLQGYKGWQTRLEITAGEEQTVPEVVLEKADGKILITSEPAGASITISGRYYGQAPVNVTLPPGENYEIQASQAGYQAASRKLTVVPDQSSQVSIRLLPVTGTIRLQVEPADALLVVDGEPRGAAPRVLELTARNHEIRLEKPGYAPFVRNLLPDPDYDQQLTVRLKTEAEAEQEATPQLITTSTGNELKLILPGEFTMGAPRREPGRRSNEVEKTVQLTRAYYLGVTEVTNEQYRQFMSSHDSGSVGRSMLNLAERPVVNVSWDLAVEFLNWLSGKDGLPAAYERVNGDWELVTPANTGYRLPTEAEWAWAARYADLPLTRFPWGDNMPPQPKSGNFADESAEHLASYIIAGYNDTFRGTSPPGTFGPNGFGIVDMAGNVAEWVHDRYGVNPSPGKLVDPTGPSIGDTRVIRGSSFMHGRFSELRWTFRENDTQPRPDVGFRIARYLE